MGSDEKFMRVALALAKKGAGNVSPNPRVGCVVVRNGIIVGRGWHKKFGGPHAEVFALREAGGKAHGATLYVNLEPCNHFGKTPPCAPAIIRAGVKRVACAMRDPHKIASGGLQEFAAAGISAKCGVLEKEARELNESFVKLVTAGRPFVVLKAAVTADGFIARGGERHGGKRHEWISGRPARRVVHGLRHECDAILVGVGTVLADDPKLTVRIRGKKIARQPLRVVLDPMLRAPVDSKVFARGNALVATLRGAPAAKKRALVTKGVRLLQCKADAAGEIDLKFLLGALGKMGVASVFVEGGGRVFSSFLKRRLVDKFYLFVSPKKFASGVPFVDEKALGELMKAKIVSGKKVGKDFLFEGRF